MTWLAGRFLKGVDIFLRSILVIATVLAMTCINALSQNSVATAFDSLAISAQTGWPLNAFTAQHPPDIKITVKNKRADDWQGRVRVQRFDLLGEKTVVEWLSIRVSAGGQATTDYKPSLPFGVYRIDFALSGDASDSSPSSASQRLFFAYAPAHEARELPDDWPLATHINNLGDADHGEPLPGFKWYRYFKNWTTDNPARGQYDWSRLDSAFAKVKAMGGRMLLAGDGTPDWTVGPGRIAGMPWMTGATAYPPDNMEDLRTYLRTLIKRYDDGSGTLAAWETVNEANTLDRWLGTMDQLVEEAKIFREVSRETKNPPLLVGIVVSAGRQDNYVNAVIKAGILPYLDIVSGHFYEELLSYERETPINNLPIHVDMLTKPMHDAGSTLPIWNTESGIGITPREDGRLVSQQELNRRASQSPGAPKDPWLLDEKGAWRPLSERRAAGTYVAGTVMLLEMGVEKTFTFNVEGGGWIMDGAPALPWVATMVLGDQIKGLDFHHVSSVSAVVKGDKPGVKALAYRLGASDKPGVIVAWSFLSDLTVGRSKAWQPWLDVQPVRVTIQKREAEITDLYGRTTTRLPIKNGEVVIEVGEEPVYIREIQ